MQREDITRNLTKRTREKKSSVKKFKINLKQSIFKSKLTLKTKVRVNYVLTRFAN